MRSPAPDEALHKVLRDSLGLEIDLHVCSYRSKEINNPNPLTFGSGFGLYGLGSLDRI